MEVAVSTEESADAVRCQFLLSTNRTVGKRTEDGLVENGLGQK